MILIIIGALLIIWAIWARGGGNPANAAEIFRGSAGGILNILVILVGVILVLVGVF